MTTASSPFSAYWKYFAIINLEKAEEAMARTSGHGSQGILNSIRLIKRQNAGNITKECQVMVVAANIQCRHAARTQSSAAAASIEGSVDSIPATRGRAEYQPGVNVEMPKTDR